ncbi:DNA-3-methyladenine glycosylase I [Kytococcus sedentarius]|uniref:DNA-3-methyladenine glycosylase I n=1 Tax=Kytococcus sedentarius TaxID=1276 RepID=UPI00387A215D
MSGGGVTASGRGPGQGTAGEGAAPGLPAGSEVVVGADGLARTPWGDSSDLMRHYYDTEWGLPVRDEAGLFERLTLEAFQSGLSWATILRKRPAFREAFAGFDADAVAAFEETDVERLMADARIVRNRRKVEATITNARATVALRAEGGLVDLVWSFQPAETPRPLRVAEVPTRSPESRALSRTLKDHGFTFVGPTTVYALMEAIGMVDTHLVGSHRRGVSGLWPH